MSHTSDRIHMTYDAHAEAIADELDEMTDLSTRTLAIVLGASILTLAEEIQTVMQERMDFDATNSGGS